MIKLLSLLFLHIKKCHSSVVRVLTGAGRRVVEERDRVSALLGKHVGRVKSIFGQFFKLKSSLFAFVKRVIEALLVNTLFIFFAKTVQAIFWICAGIGIYAVVLIATQPDGHERVMNFIKHVFGEGW